jgi:hypothetical protein
MAVADWSGDRRQHGRSRELASMVKGGQMTGPTAAEDGEWFSLTEAAQALGLQREALRSQVRRKRFLTARANDNSLRIFIRHTDRARLAPTTNPVSDPANDRPVIDAEIAELRAEWGSEGVSKSPRPSVTVSSGWSPTATVPSLASSIVWSPWKKRVPSAEAEGLSLAALAWCRSGCCWHAPGGRLQGGTFI